MLNDDSPAPGLHLESLTAWLAQELPELSPPFAASRLAGGRSNLTFLLLDAVGRRLVLRRPPLGDLPATAHDVTREARKLQALAGMVPVPKVHAICTDASVTGAPFFVMEHLEGRIVRDPESAAEASAPIRANVGPSLIDTLVTLHAIDPEHLGLGELARRGDYSTRQLRRWHDNWRDTRTRASTDLENTYEWLLEHRLEQRTSSLLHGDFRIDNCVLDEDGRVLGILDWELSTAGDPLADLGQLLVYWAEPADGFTALHNPPTRVEGYSSRADLRERYLTATGADPAGVDYYIAFNWWKTACIVENVYSRMLRGAMGATDRSPESFGEQARALAAHAARQTRQN